MIPEILFAGFFVLNFAACLLFACAWFRRYCPAPDSTVVRLCEPGIVGVLFFVAETWFFIEGLSAFNLLKHAGPLALLHGLSLAGFTLGLVVYRESLGRVLRESFKASKGFRLLIVVFTATILLPLVVYAVYYPPCSADSMSYHLPRVMHWMQNGNVDLYPTKDLRQLYIQPLVEYFFLSWELLSGSDFFDNTVQVVALPFLLMSLLLLVDHFGGRGRSRLLAALFVLSSTVVMLEVPTTQVDLVVLTLFLFFLYFGLKLVSNDTPDRTRFRVYAICFGVSLGLSLNAKLSVAPFEIPFCAWFGWKLLSKYRSKALPVYAALVAGFLLFNGPYFVRNLEITGSPFGDSKLRDMVRNSRFGYATTVSNILRNTGQQLLIPCDTINQFNKRTLILMHDVLGIEWGDVHSTFIGNDPDAAVYGYRAIYIFDDYRTGNVVIVLAFGFVVFALLAGKTKNWLFSSVEDRGTQEKSGPKKNKSSRNFKHEKRSALFSPQEENRRELLVFTVLILVGFVLFSGLFRWQPFGSRLLLPAYIGLVPFIAIELDRIFSKRFFTTFVVVLYAISLVIVALLCFKALSFSPEDESTYYWFRDDEKAGRDDEIVRDTYIRAPEYLSAYETPRPLWKQYSFRRDYHYYRLKSSGLLVDYLGLVDRIASLECKNVGLALNIEQVLWEYPIQLLLRKRGVDCRIESVVFPESLKRTRNYDPDFVPDVIITNLTPDHITSRYEIEHAWKYKEFVLAKVKTGRPPIDR